jgi:chromatin assembly factor 1 subunit A
MSVSEEQTHPQSLKRDHDQFLSGEREIASGSLGMDSSYRDIYPSPLEKASHKERTANPEQSILTPPTSITTTRRGTSPARSSTGSLSDARSTTPSLQSNSPTPFGPPTLAPVAALKHPDGTLAPPPKKAKLTPAEKELRRINKMIKDQERAAEKARREVERLAHAEEKARKEAEKEAEKKKREAEREEKRAAQDAEKAAKEEKRKQREEDKRQREEEKRQKDDGKRQKEEEKKRAEEEKRKKDRSQMKLNSFFVQKSNAGDRTSLSPAPSNPALGAAATSPAPPTPSKPEASYYDQTFPAFFVQAHVTVAPITRFERDEETSKIQQTIIDSYILRNRSPGRRRSFDALSLFHLPTNAVRGKHCIPVREIMAEMSNSASRPIDLTSDSQNSQIRRTGHLLKKVPLKYLKFAEDVRPPYRGTYTNQPLHGVAKLARNPLRRDLPDTNYDYDSEAEWIEDEDAEDLNSEGEEDDVELDDADDMDGFLDDENDELLTSKRQVLQGDLEPISTGLCWEDQSGNNTNTRMVDYRMETILGTLHPPPSIQDANWLADEKLRSIDPFSTGYWEPVSTKVTTMDPPRLPLNTLKSNSLCNNSSSSSASTTSKPVKPFFAPASTYSNFSIDSAASKPQYAANKGKEKKLLPKEDWASFKDEVQGSNLSKVGLIEVLKKRFPKATGGMVKATLEAVAQRVGKKESEKRWIVNEDAGAVSMASN